ncbi:MJ0042-type zinc finger domain-containing protein, partial [Pseudomonas sp. SG-MS2]|uniref:MJ0042-type zinc finger domain-containing protein n=1 Tax=Pseudomonas sp. SG-MS2 TaxID=1914534 RepID=UPI0021139CEA
MTDSFVTQCPHCQTSFRVTHHQLSVARGVVRCGHCLQVFNAAKQLLEQNRASAAPAVPPIPVVALVTAPEPPVSERSAAEP